MATDDAGVPADRAIDSNDLPSNGGDAEVPTGLGSRSQGADIEGTGSTGGIGVGDRTGDVSGDLTTMVGAAGEGDEGEDPTLIDEDSGD